MKPTQEVESKPDVEVAELSELELAFVGGGIGDTAV
jgi:hypothetical protein